MRQWTLIILVGLLLFAAGCGNGTTTVNATEDVRRISPSKAKELVEAGEAILYDTRSADAFRAQHAKGAVSLPEEELASRIGELPSEEETALIFY